MCPITVDEIPDHHLLIDVMTARSTLASARHRHGPRPGDVDAARHRLVMALEAYLSRLDASGWPAPSQLLNELRLHRGLDRGRP